MATDYTTHYNLDKYTATDKPNLRDQYNAAMDKVDAELWSQKGDVADAKNMAQSALNQVADKVTTTQMNTAINNAVYDRPTTTQMNTAINSAVSDKPTTTQMNTAINNAVSNRPTTTQMNTAILHRNRAANIVVIGDSWSQNGDYWRNVYTDRYPDTIRSYAQGGVGFMGVLDDNPNSFPVQLNTAINDANLDKQAVTHVLVMGGVNDYTYNYRDAGQLSAVIRTMAVSIKNNFPNAKPIFVIGNMNYRDYGPGNPGTWTTPGTNLHQIYTWNRVRKYCANLGIIAECMYGWIGKPDYKSDFIHPGSSAAYMIAANVHALIHGGDVNYRINAQSRSATALTCEVNMTIRTDDILVSAKTTIAEGANTAYLSTLVSGNSNAIPFNIVNTGTQEGFMIPAFTKFPGDGPFTIGVGDTRYAFYTNSAGAQAASRAGVYMGSICIPIPA